MVERRLRCLRWKARHRTNHASSASSEGWAVFLDNHRTRTLTIAVGSWLRVKSRAGDGRFQDAVAKLNPSQSWIKVSKIRRPRRDTIHRWNLLIKFPS